MTAEEHFFENVHNLDEQWSAVWRSLWEARSAGDNAHVARCDEILRRLDTMMMKQWRQGSTVEVVRATTSEQLDYRQGEDDEDIPFDEGDFLDFDDGPPDSPWSGA